MNLLGKIERHLRQTGMPATRFGREAVRDPRLVRDMRLGREIGVALRTRIMAYLEDGR